MSKADKLAAILVKDPDLDNQQLRERGYSTGTIGTARKRTGIQAPRQTIEVRRLRTPERFCQPDWLRDTP